MMSLGKVAVLLATIVVAIKAQRLEYPVAPTAQWVESTTGIFNDNGVYVAPDDSIVVSISQSCVVRANSAMSGRRIWTFVPDGGDGFRCFGGVTFNYDATFPYLVFSVVDNPFDDLLATT
jgi:hypothetical protein